MSTNRVIPPTQTPASVIVVLLVLVGALAIIFLSSIGKWGFVPLFLILGISTYFYIKDDVPAYNCLPLINSFNGIMRVVFPGINLKLPWEKAISLPGAKDDLLDLRIELRDVCNETYPSKDGAVMSVRYVYTIRPDIDNDYGMTPSEKVLIFLSFQRDAIKSKGKAVFSQLLSDYYGKNEPEDLLKKEVINKKVFGTRTSPTPRIIEFERNHGAEVTVTIEDSDYSENTQKFRDIVTGAKSLNDARIVLMRDDVLADGTVIKGMTEPEANKFLKLMKFESGFTEKEFNVNIKAPDLQNLRDISVLGGAGLFGKEGGKK